MKRDRDKEVIQIFLDCYNTVAKDDFRVQSYPDEENRKTKSVDVLCENSNRKTLAIEHTRIEGFPGEMAAEVNLSFMYRYGLGAPQSCAEAFRWMSKAADRGLPPADSTLADMYESGCGVEHDFEKALKYYRKAAREHYGPAENGLG